jgi:acetylornithine deacetylase/succinyl-diaminopimelate desuccinylase-like protein
MADVVLRRTIELAELPAPTGFEANRAALVRSWWDADGMRDVLVDDTGNVWAHARGGDGAAVILCAHIDTVFGPGMSHRTRSDGSRLCGPGVGDDAAAAVVRRRHDGNLLARRSIQSPRSSRVAQGCSPPARGRNSHRAA